MDTSSLNRRLMRSQIALVRLALRRLGELAALPEADFLADPDHYAIAEHHLRRSLETALDVGRHMVARLGLGRAQEYADVPRLLGDHGILSPATTIDTVELAQVRDRLVLSPWQVGREEIHQLLQTRLGHLERFCVEILDFLRTNRPQTTPDAGG